MRDRGFDRGVGLPGSRGERRWIQFDDIVLAVVDRALRVFGRAGETQRILDVDLHRKHAMVDMVVLPLDGDVRGADRVSERLTSVREDRLFIGAVPCAVTSKTSTPRTRR